MTSITHFPSRTFHESQRIVPINLDAERCVLGAVIEDDSLLPDVIAAGLKPEHFAVSDHRRVFQAMLALHLRKVPIDYVLLTQELGNRREEHVLVASLIHGVVVEVNHILHHVGIVRRNWQVRRFQKIGEWMMGIVDTLNPDALIEDAIGKLEAIATAEVVA